ncbi:GNAT family N-acetyltransferase [Niabella beijingensis]|uniref:GNAT family N-acetyltransferase n=1 Tax=Niabella beijingensis TaxID=2872700 RepID=UPI001CBD1BF6|nr:GNAT family N-acetyltransferase [Niabella beijingensis]MBZ4188948.1 GNAT family N-acetyltransferase [Niabella beijingensis]
MREAQNTDKSSVVEILARSFATNKSVNYIIGDGKKRTRRLNALMAYSYDFCKRNGEVFLSEDGSGCALIVMPDEKRTTLLSIFQDLRLVFTCIGLKNLSKAIKRESIIKRHHPNSKLYYLWYIGVDPLAQGNGIGTVLLSELIQRGQALGRTICLETSTEINLPWYKENGFATYKTIDLGYPLYFLKHQR